MKDRFQLLIRDEVNAIGKTICNNERTQALVESSKTLLLNNGKKVSRY